MADTTFTALPMVGQPDSDNRLAGFVNSLRIESMPERDNFLGFDASALNYYLYGTNNPGMAHVYNKTKGMINSFVAQAAKYPPVISIKPITIQDGGETVANTAGEPVILNAQNVAAWFQTIFDVVYYTRSRGDKWFQQMCLLTKLFGCQDSLCEYDRTKKACEFRIVPPIQWYKDPTANDIDDMAYMGLDWPVDAEWAKKTYPDIADQIDNIASRSVYQAPSSDGYSSLYLNKMFARPIVTLCIWWLRNRERPMTDQEAIAAGVVEARQMPMEVPSVPDDSGTPMGSGDTAGNAEAVAGSEPVDVPGAEGIPPQPPAMREALFSVQTGEEMDGQHPDWPIQKCLSQTIQLGNNIVLDVVCPSWDIPVCSGYNIKIPLRPYGQSACQDTSTQQTDLNTVHGNIIEHSDYFRSPTSVASEAIQEKIPEGMKNRHMTPGTTYWVDAAAAMQVGGVKSLISTIDPPPLPPALVTVRDQLIQSFDDTGGHPEVSQGMAPTSNASGELAKTLLSASQQNNEYTFLSLHEMVFRNSKTCIDYIIQDFTVADYLAINKNYDPLITQLMMQIIKSKAIEFTPDVEGAWDKQQREQQIRQDLALGLIDMETARDKLGYDHKTISMRQQAQAMASSAVDGANNGEQEQLNGSKKGNSASGKPQLKVAS